MRLSFQDLCHLPPAEAEPFLKRWYFWATHSRLEPMIRVARTIREHWDGVLRWFGTRISNGILEAINSLIPGSEGGGARLPHNPQPHRHGVSDCG